MITTFFLVSMLSRVYLFLFPPRGDELPPILRGRLNPHPCLQRCRFPVPRYAKRPSDALCAIDPFLLLPTPSSPHSTRFRTRLHGVGNRPLRSFGGASPPTKSSRAHSYLLPQCSPIHSSSRGHGCMFRSDPMVWSLGPIMRSKGPMVYTGRSLEKCSWRRVHVVLHRYSQ